MQQIWASGITAHNVVPVANKSFNAVSPPNAHLQIIAKLQLCRATLRVH